MHRRREFTRSSCSRCENGVGSNGLFVPHIGQITVSGNEILLYFFHCCIRSFPFFDGAMNRLRVPQTAGVSRRPRRGVHLCCESFGEPAARPASCRRTFRSTSLFGVVIPSPPLDLSIAPLKIYFKGYPKSKAQSMDGRPCSARKQFVWEKCLQPKNPLYADSGEGCAQVRMRC